jgi:hypothetical protein
LELGDQLISLWYCKCRTTGRKNKHNAKRLSEAFSAFLAQYQAMQPQNRAGRKQKDSSTSLQVSPVRAITFSSTYIRRIYQKWFSNSLGLCCVWPTSPITQRPYMRFLFVGLAKDLPEAWSDRNSHRRLPSDSIARWTPLPLANASCYRGALGTYALELVRMTGTLKKGQTKKIWICPLKLGWGCGVRTFVWGIFWRLWNLWGGILVIM